MKAFKFSLAQIRILYIATTIFLIGLCLFTYSKLNSLNKAAEKLHHSAQISVALEKILSSIKDAEVSQRGYLLTHDETFLRAFYKELHQYPLHLKKANQLIGDNTIQRKNFSIASTLCEKRVQHLLKVQEISKLKAPSVAELQAGNLIMDSLRSRLSTINAAENEVSSIFSAKYKQVSSTTPITIIVLFIGSILVLLTSYFRLNKSMIDANKSSKALKEIVTEAHAAICMLRGPKHYIELANTQYLQLVHNKNICYKYFAEALPELASSNLGKIIDSVYNTGITIEKMGVTINVSNNEHSPIYKIFDFTYIATHDDNNKIDGVVINADEVTLQIEAKRAIEESNLRYKDLINKLPVAVYTCDKNGIIQLYNEAAVALWGRVPTDNDRWCGSWKIYNIDETPLPHEQCPMAITLKTGHITKMDVIIERPDGTKRYILPSPQPIFDAKKNIIGSINTLVDITEQIDAINEIETKEEQLRIAIEGGELGTFNYYPQTNELEWSDKTKEIFGLHPAAQITYDDYILALHPDDLGNIKTMFDIVDRPNIGEMIEIEYRIFALNDGKLKWLRTNGKIALDAKRRIVRFTGVIQDITTQKLAREIIKENEKRFRSLAETLPQLIWTTNQNGMLEFASARWEEYSGVKPTGINEWEEIVHPDDLQDINKVWTHCLSSGDVFKHNVRLRSKIGLYAWHRVIGVPVRDENNKILNWVGAFTEINDETLFLLKLELQVKERTIELLEKNETLERANRELELFAHISSHDLQEPLRKVQMSISRIHEKDFDIMSEKGKVHFTSVQQATASMQTLIDDLLIYSRTNSAEGNFENTDLNLILKEVLDGLKDRIEEKKAIIECANLCELNIIPFEFKQLMHNLIGNSLKFSKTNIPPHIVINSISSYGSKLHNSNLKPDEMYFYLNISDNGIGFESQYNEKIFEAFQRLHGKEKYNGTGIGLAIAKKIVVNHQGIITAKGELDKGAIFEIYLPIDKANYDE